MNRIAKSLAAILVASSLSVSASRAEDLTMLTLGGPNKHIHRHLNEVSGKKSRRDLDTVERMSALVCSMVGKRLRFQDPIAETPEEIAEMEARKAEEAAQEAEREKRRELVDREYDFFKRICPDTEGVPPLPMARIPNRTEI